MEVTTAKNKLDQKNKAVNAKIEKLLAEKTAADPGYDPEKDQEYLDLLLKKTFSSNICANSEFGNTFHAMSNGEKKRDWLASLGVPEDQLTRTWLDYLKTSEKMFTVESPFIETYPFLPSDKQIAVDVAPDERGTWHSIGRSKKM